MVLPIFFPLYFLEWRIGSIPISVLEAVVWGVFFLWLINLFIKKVNFIFSSYWIFYTLFFALIIILGVSVFLLPAEVVFEGVLYKPFFRGLGIMKEWFVAPIIYVFLMTQILPDEKAQTYLKKFFIAGAFLLAIFSFTFGEFSTDGRLLGFFSNPNYLALYLTPAAVMAMLELVKNKGRERVETLIFAFPLVLAVFLTKSYNAILVLAFLSFTWSVFNLKGRNLVYFLSGFFVLIFGVLFSEYGSDKLMQFFVNNEAGYSSLDVRLEVWQVALKLASENILFGVGLGNFQLEYWQNAWNVLGHSPLEWNVLHTHNLYLQWLTEVGLFGLFVFLGIIFFALRKITVTSSYDLRWVLGSILLLGFLDLPLFKDDLAWEFFMIFGLVLISSRMIYGRVVQGKKKAGRELGFPTINLKTESKIFLNGVYAARVFWRGQTFDSAVFAGLPKTFGEKEKTLEVHVLNFDSDVYGDEIEVEVVRRIRGVKRFKNTDALKKQIAKDCRKIKMILNKKLK